MKPLRSIVWRRLCLACLLLLLGGCVNQPFRFESLHNIGSLEHWVEWDLIPYLRRNLAEHPRLRSQAFTVVRMEDGVIQPRIDGLTRDLRRRITDALVRTPGVRVARLPVGESRHHRRLTGADCGDPLDSGYFIGIESSGRPDQRWRVAVRILDAREGAWVSGFGLEWRGRLTPSQQAALEASREDELLRGLRVLPFRADQPDLAARYFANNLSCLLRQRGLSESRIHLALPSKPPRRLATLIGLVDNYLSRMHQVQVVDRAQAAEYLLESEFHPIDDDLYQLWFRLRARDGAGQVPGLDTAAYIRLPALRPAAPAVAKTPARKRRPPRPSVDSLELLHPREPGLCRGPGPVRGGYHPLPAQGLLSPDDCFQVRARGRGRLFLMFHRPQGGLVRIDQAQCADRALRLADGPGIGTLYALAVTDPGQAADIQRLWRRLDSACEAGGGGPDAETWSVALDRLIARGPKTTAWSALRYRFHAQE